MNLSCLLAARACAQNPITVGVIGAGKFGAMFLTTAARSPGIHVAVIADLSPGRAQENLLRIGWAAEQSAAASLDDALRRDTTHLTDNAALVNDPRIEVVVESTGNPAAGIAHALAAIEARQHIVIVNVEADVLAGPLLARKAAAAGCVYSMA